MWVSIELGMTGVAYQMPYSFLGHASVCFTKEQMAFGRLCVFALYAFAHHARSMALSLLILFPVIDGSLIPQYVYAHQTAHAVNQFGCQLGYTASPVLHTRRVRISILATMTYKAK